MQLLDTFEDYCEQQGIDPVKSLPDVSGMPEALQKSQIAAAKLMIINWVMAEGRVFDWKNSNQRKWMPFFWMNGPSGFRFDGSAYGGTDTYVGSLLYYFSEKESDHVGQTFEDLYRDMMVIE